MLWGDPISFEDEIEAHKVINFEDELSMIESITKRLQVRQPKAWVPNPTQNVMLYHTSVTQTNLLFRKYYLK